MSKQTKKSTVKASVLSKAQRSIIAKFAALKAHCHKSFQSERDAADRKQTVKNYNTALASAPALIRERFERI